MVDFRLNGFDILPDFVGYLLFYIGLSKMLSANSNFGKAKNVSLLMVFLSLPSLLQMELYPANVGWGFGMILFSIIVVILDLYIVFHICRGIEELASQRSVHDLAAQARSRWTLYFILNVLVLMLMVFAFANILAILVIPLFIFSIIVLILLMGLMKAAEARLH